MLKKVMTILTVVLIAVLSAITVSANNISYETEEIDWTESGIKMAVDGKEIIFPDQKPLLDGKAGRTYIPIRFLAEALGANVEWNNEHQVVEIVNKGIEGENTKNVYYLKIGSNKIVQARYEKGGNLATKIRVFYMPENIKPVLEGGRTVIPFRYITELLGSQVYYDPTTGVAHCVKRDLTKYPKNMRDGSVPVMNSLIGEYFVDELNKYRAANGAGPVVWNGDYSDMMTWAAFDQITHPGQWEYYKKHFNGTELHLFSFNRETDVNSRLEPYEVADKYELDHEVWHVGAYWQYVRTYLPNHPEYAKYADIQKSGPYSKNTFDYWTSYSENAFVTNPLLTEFAQNLDLSAELYTEFTKYWGLKVMKLDNVTYDQNLNLIPGPKNGEHQNIVIYNEASYRKMAKYAIDTWATSNGHKQIMINKRATQVGFATVGEYAYMCTTSK